MKTPHHTKGETVKFQIDYENFLFSLNYRWSSRVFRWRCRRQLRWIKSHWMKPTILILLLLCAGCERKPEPQFMYEANRAEVETGKAQSQWRNKHPFLADTSFFSMPHLLAYGLEHPYAVWCAMEYCQSNGPAMALSACSTNNMGEFPNADNLTVVSIIGEIIISTNLSGAVIYIHSAYKSKRRQTQNRNNRSLDQPTPTNP